MTREEDEQQALELEERFASMTDKEVVAEYHKTTGELGDSWVDRLFNEIREREAGGGYRQRWIGRICLAWAEGSSAAQ